MPYKKELFTEFDHIQFGLRLDERLSVKSQISLIVFKIASMALVSFVALITEANIFYSFFEYLAGDEGKHWSPIIMAMTVFIVICTFHLIAKMKPNSTLIIFVERIVHVLIPIYLIGACLFISNVMFNDGIGEIAVPEASIVLGAIPQAIESGLVDLVFEYVIGPLSLLGISIGVGSLAIMNLFLIHHLMVRIFANIEKIRDYKSSSQSAGRECQDIMDKEERYNNICLELESLDSINDDDIRADIADKVMCRISDALLHHKQWLSKNKHNRRSNFYTQFMEHDPEQVEKAVAEMEAITLEDIMKAIDAEHINLNSGGRRNVQ